MPKDKGQVQKFIDVLEEAGYEPESYSGRNMYGKCCVMERIVFTHGMAARESDRFGEWKEIDCEPVPLTLGELTLSMGLAADQITWDTQRFMRYIKWRHV